MFENPYYIGISLLSYMDFTLDFTYSWNWSAVFYVYCLSQCRTGFDVVVGWLLVDREIALCHVIPSWTTVCLLTSRVVAFRIGILQWWKKMMGSRPHSLVTIDFVIVKIQCMCCVILFCRHTIHLKKYAYGLCFVVVWLQSILPISFRITSLSGAILTIAPVPVKQPWRILVNVSYESTSINPLWPSDAIRRQRSESTLAQVMACCLTATTHYLNQCWLISKDQ